MKVIILLILLILFNLNIYSNNNIYFVKKGDTLSEISLNLLGSSKFTNIIAKNNKIQNIDMIYVGQKIIISKKYFKKTLITSDTNNVIAKEIKNSKKNTIYIVKKNDTLSDISFKFYRTLNPKYISKIMEINNLQSHNIYPGMVLNLQKSSETSNNITSVKHENDKNLKKRIMKLAKILRMKLNLIRNRRIQHDKLMNILEETNLPYKMLNITQI